MRGQAIPRPLFSTSHLDNLSSKSSANHLSDRKSVYRQAFPSSHFDTILIMSEESFKHPLGNIRLLDRTNYAVWK